jgi:hypothetical protein
MPDLFPYGTKRIPFYKNIRALLQKTCDKHKKLEDISEVKSSK